MIIILIYVKFAFNYFIFSVGVQLEVSSEHEEDIFWMINFDKTEHKLGTKAYGIQGQQYHNLSFLQAGDQTVKSNKHIAGVDCTIPLEVLPQLFIYVAKLYLYYIIDPAVCQGLPKVCGKFGTDVKQIWE